MQVPKRSFEVTVREVDLPIGKEVAFQLTDGDRPAGDTVLLVKLDCVVGSIGLDDIACTDAKKKHDRHMNKNVCRVEREWS